MRIGIDWGGTKIEAIALSDAGAVLARSRIRELAAGVGAAFNAVIDVEIRDIFSVLHNSEEQAAAAAEIAAELFGRLNMDPAVPPKMGSEDFADMLHAVPGAT